MSIVGIALLVALCIPIVAILLDSQVGRALAARLERQSPSAGDDDAVAELERRLHLLEGDVEILQHTVTQLREESQFLQSLLEENRGRPLPPPDGS
jgi:hypothetical protein